MNFLETLYLHVFKIILHQFELGFYFYEHLEVRLPFLSDTILQVLVKAISPKQTNPKRFP